MAVHRRPALTVAAAAAWALASPALAQMSGSTGGSSFNAGYNAASSEFSSGINVSRAYDSSGNRVVVDGVTRTGDDQSVFYSRRTGGSGDSYSGVGATGSGTAVGNNLVVSVQGSNNTVVVNATQTNTGAVTNTTVLNGKVDIDGQD